jgi:hypothetical protein
MSFYRLPSGLCLNVSSVRRISPTRPDRLPGLTVFFTETDHVSLDEIDSASLTKAAGLRSVQIGPNAKTAIFLGRDYRGGVASVFGRSVCAACDTSLLTSVADNTY